jgi:hypothetical protein
VPTFPVTENAVRVATAFSVRFIVRNDGLTTVYLGQDSSLTVDNRAFTLGPGASLNWAADTDLYAITALGETGAIEYLYTGDTSFTPGPSVVEAVNLINSEQLFNTIVDVINDGVSLLYSGTCAGYTTLRVEIQVGLGGALAAPNGETYTIYVQQYDSAGNAFKTEYFYYNGIGHLVIPIIGDSIDITLNATLALPAPGSRRIEAWLYTAPLPRQYYNQPVSLPSGVAIVGYTSIANINAGEFWAGANFVVAASPATCQYYLPHYAGPATLCSMVSGTAAGTTSMELYVTEALGSTFLDLWRRTVTVAANAEDNVNVEVTLPERPLAIQVSAATISKRYEFTLSSSPPR